MTDSDVNRGERQQASYLWEAKRELELAFKLHRNGLIDPALARADTAAGHLEAYRLGPVLRRDAPDDGDDDADTGGESDA